MTQNNNPLISPFDTPFETTPFHLITPGHYMPAVEEGISQAKAEVQAIIDNTETPNFENTVAALDYTGLLLGRVNGTLSNQNSAETNAEIQKVVKEASSAVSTHINEIWQNEQLFARVKEVYGQKDHLGLSESQH
ncbi:MAG: hypothetical protein AAFO69_07485 [Bacteroidota bacterium]